MWSHVTPIKYGTKLQHLDGAVALALYRRPTKRLVLNTNLQPKHTNTKVKKINITKRNCFKMSDTHAYDDNINFNIILITSTFKKSPPETNVIFLYITERDFSCCVSEIRLNSVC